MMTICRPEQHNMTPTAIKLSDSVNIELVYCDSSKEPVKKVKVVDLSHPVSTCQYCLLKEEARSTTVFF